MLAQSQVHLFFVAKKFDLKWFLMKLQFKPQHDHHQSSLLIRTTRSIESWSKIKETNTDNDQIVIYFARKAAIDENQINLKRK